MQQTEIDFSRSIGSTKLIAVSKVQPVERIKSVLDAGHRVFGENRVQEAQSKWIDLKHENSEKNIELHLIGPLQSNKVSLALDIFDVIQTVDREKIALKLKKYVDQEHPMTF